MLKKYIFSQIKNLFVPGVIALIVLLTSGIIIGSNAEPIVTYSVYQNGMIFTRTIERVVNSNTINILPLIIIATLLAWLYPLWVFNYRYSLKKVDLFYQAPLKENTIKKTRLLVLFISPSVTY